MKKNIYTPLRRPEFLNDDFAQLNFYTRVQTVVSGIRKSMLEELPSNPIFMKKRNILHFAISHRHDTCFISGIHSTSADINHQDEDGFTPMHLAVEENMLHAVRYLLQKGALPNLVDPYGRTALHLAVQSTVQMVDLLLASGADPTIRTNKGRTLAHLAADTNVEMINRVIGTGVDINGLDFTGRSPLHYANDMLTLSKHINRNVADATALVELLQSNGAIDIGEHRIW